MHLSVCILWVCSVVLIYGCRLCVCVCVCVAHVCVAHAHANAHCSIHGSRYATNDSVDAIMHGQDHTEAAVHTIWNRVVKLSDAANPGSGLVCARQGVNLVDLCVKNSASPDTSAAPGATGSIMPADGSDYEHAYRDIDVRDCNVLRAVVQDTCAFAAPEGRRYSAMCHALEKTKLLTMCIRRRMRSTACIPS